MLGRVLTVLIVTFSGFLSVSVGSDFPQAPVSEGEVRLVVGEVLSHDADTLVIVSDAGERLTFDLSTATDIPEPLPSGIRVRIEFLEGDVELDALNVVPARCVR